MSNIREKTRMLAVMGILTALVIVLQTVATGIKLGPFSITLVLAPIVIGAAMYGWKAGAWLGFVFGCIALTDAAAFMAVSVPGTVITCILKGVLAGIAAAAVYKLLEKVNFVVAVVAAAIVCPVVNTGIFLLGCLVFFYSTIQEWAGGTNVGVYMITGLVGLNFVVEAAINLVLSTAIVSILKIVKKPALQS